jgi:hypothetical protein
MHCWACRPRAADRGSNALSVASPWADSRPLAPASARHDSCGSRVSAAEAGGAVRRRRRGSRAVPRESGLRLAAGPGPGRRRLSSWDLRRSPAQVRALAQFTRVMSAQPAARSRSTAGSRIVRRRDAWWSADQSWICARAWLSLMPGFSCAARFGPVGACSWPAVPVARPAGPAMGDQLGGDSAVVLDVDALGPCPRAGLAGLGPAGREFFVDRPVWLPVLRAVSRWSLRIWAGLSAFLVPRSSQEHSACRSQ